MIVMMQLCTKFVLLYGINFAFITYIIYIFISTITRKLMSSSIDRLPRPLRELVRLKTQHVSNRYYYEWHSHRGSTHDPAHCK